MIPDYAAPQVTTPGGPKNGDLAAGAVVVALFIAHGVAIVLGYLDLLVLFAGLLLPLLAALVVLVLLHRTIRPPWDRRLISARLILIAALGLLGAFYCWGHGVRRLFDTRHRLAVSRAGGIDPLRVWAQQVLSLPAGQRPVDGSGNVRPASLPPQYRQLYEVVRIDSDEGGAGDYMLLLDAELHGDHRWGLLIGKTGFKPTPGQGPAQEATMVQWRDGVYRWEDWH